MYTEEIEVLLSDIQDLEKQRIKWNGKESKVIGFLVVDQDVEPLIKGEHVPGDLQPVEKVGRGFLALGQTIASEEDCLQNDDRACSIGLDLAHAFPRTVAGEQSAVVKRTKHHDDLRLLSVNHVVWMNGWAQPPCKIVSKQIGRASCRERV